jgi:hypothetical protein
MGVLSVLSICIAHVLHGEVFNKVQDSNYCLSTRLPLLQSNDCIGRTIILPGLSHRKGKHIGSWGSPGQGLVTHYYIWQLGSGGFPGHMTWPGKSLGPKALEETCCLSFCLHFVLCQTSGGSGPFKGVCLSVRGPCMVETMWPSRPGFLCLCFKWPYSLCNTQLLKVPNWYLTQVKVKVTQ